MSFGTALRDVTLRSVTLRDIALRDMTLRDVMLRGVTLRDVTLREKSGQRRWATATASVLPGLPLREIRFGRSRHGAAFGLFF